MLPIEFVVPGSPATVQSSSTKKAAWRARTAKAAQAVWPPGMSPLNEPLSALVVFFHARNDQGDADNMLKTTLDALNGIVYVDDNQVTQVTGVRVSLDDPIALSNPSPALVDAMERQLRFVYVQVRALVPLREVL